jgi:hypothetical protein
MPCEFLSSIHQISAREWNALCPETYPFVRHEFLAALEDSGSTNAASGWQPQHLLIRERGELVAAMPLYLKQHSYGEYVFDWGWADAYRRHGYHYYPKLISAIPFTPCQGPRLLTGSTAVSEPLLDDLVTGMQELGTKLHASGWHCLFPEQPLCTQLHTRGIHRRLGCQFHWFNRGYGSFGDFVGTLSSRKRKNILKERRQVAERGFRFVVKEGTEISTSDWDYFHSLYQITYLKRSGHGGYLTRDFFQRIGATMPQNTLMIIAEHQQGSVAAALFFFDKDTLYGRYWGCAREFDFLHFETCYYQGIDYAIARGLKRFDGGAQGEHKLARGFEPVPTWSNHWLENPDFRYAIEHFLGQEETAVQEYIAEAQSQLPFKQAASVGRRSFHNL